MSETASSALLSPRFEEALVWASRLHARQRRKGSGIPYLSHLMSVCALVLEDGGSEDEAIAALLHDAVEDQGGPATRAEIERRFGNTVALIVDGCTDTDETPKPPWQARKERYIAHLANASPSVLRVSLADKVHNARTMLMDVQLKGPSTWDRFTGGRDGSLWYFHRVAEAVQDRYSGFLLAELRDTIDRLEEFERRSAANNRPFNR